MNEGKALIGCNGCKHVDKEENESPCVSCIRNLGDYYERRKDDD